jgi:hypothetical protein
MKVSLITGLILAAVIAFFSLGPINLRESLGLHSGKEMILWGDPITLHRAAHFIAFTSLTFLLVESEQGLRKNLLILMAIIAFAVSIEVAQHLMSNNVIETWDIRDDTIASCLAFVPTGFRSLPKQRQIKTK